MVGIDFTPDSEKKSGRRGLVGLAVFMFVGTADLPEARAAANNALRKKNARLRMDCIWAVKISFRTGLGNVMSCK
jgi:hypothetical protein